MRRAVVIRTMGDEELSGAIVNAMVKPLESAELEAVKAELRRLKDENTQLRDENTKLGVRKVRDAAYFAEQLASLEMDCPPARKSSKAAQLLLVAWALLTLTIREFYARLDAWNREG